MTIDELMQMLDNYLGYNEVKIWDPDSHKYESVTGCIFDPNDCTIELYSDDIS